MKKAPDQVLEVLARVQMQYPKEFKYLLSWLKAREKDHDVAARTSECVVSRKEQGAAIECAELHKIFEESRTLLMARRK